jgi:hypothetical protein
MEGDDTMSTETKECPKSSPLPWKVAYGFFRVYIMEANVHEDFVDGCHITDISRSPGEYSENRDLNRVNAQLIVKCVNAYPELITALLNFVDEYNSDTATPKEDAVKLLRKLGEI